MKVSYDSEADILTVTLSEQNIVESDEQKPGVILDYDSEGRVVRIEVLHASRSEGGPRSGFEYTLVSSA